MDNEILKQTLTHYIKLEYYANEIDEEYQVLLDELVSECSGIIESYNTLNTKNDYNVLYKAIKERVDEYQKGLEERLDEVAEETLNREMRFLDNLYNKKGFSKLPLIIGGVTLAKLLFSPIDGRDTVKQFAQRTGNNILRSYDTSLRAGYLFGQDSKEISRQIGTKLKQVSRGMGNGIKTAVPAFAKTTDKIIFLHNEREVTYCATLDGSTCVVCGSMHGLKFKSISVAPSLPNHFCCRCIYIPSDEITEPLPTYEEYLNSLSDEEQYEILGKNRYNLWKKDGIKLERFVNDGHKLRLDEIDKE